MLQDMSLFSLLVLFVVPLSCPTFPGLSMRYAHEVMHTAFLVLCSCVGGLTVTVQNSGAGIMHVPCGAS